MKFYNRVSELEELAILNDQPASSGRMIKPNKSRISLAALQHKAERLLQEYQVEYRALGLEDTVEFLWLKENS